MFSSDFLFMRKDRLSGLVFATKIQLNSQSSRFGVPHKISPDPTRIFKFQANPRTPPLCDLHLRFGTIWQRERAVKWPPGCWPANGCGQETSAQRFFKGGNAVECSRSIGGEPGGRTGVLSLAAFLRHGATRSFRWLLPRVGMGRVLALIAGAAVLATYGSWSTFALGFRKLLGAYVVLFFVMAQILNACASASRPRRILCGGALIVAGGLVVMFWKGEIEHTRVRKADFT